MELHRMEEEAWRGYELDFRYTSAFYYDVRVEAAEGRFAFSAVKTPFEAPVEKFFRDGLFQPWWQGSAAYGFFEDGAAAPVAVIETWAEEWSNRLRVTELWVAEGYRRMGLGRRLMEKAKEQAVREKRRAVILETQSCNVPAIAFYLAQGFELIGFDKCCYSNDDAARKEVRLELGWFTPVGAEGEAGR